MTFPCFLGQRISLNEEDASAILKKNVSFNEVFEDSIQQQQQQCNAPHQLPLKPSIRQRMAAAGSPYRSISASTGPSAEQIRNGGGDYNPCR